MDERNGLSLPWERAVTVDWDKPAPPDWTRGRGEAGKVVRGADAVYVRESGSKGFHVVVVVPKARFPGPRGMSAIDKLRLRKLLGDDPTRLRFDAQRYKVGGRGGVSHRRPYRGDYATGVLFDWKDGVLAGKWRRTLGGK